ncbi:MAG: hypothetical protein Kow00122_03980 [Thermoleophilia bacterium]
MKRLVRFLFGIAAGAALLAYLGSERGRRTRAGLADTARALGRTCRASFCSPATTSPERFDEDALKAKIEETRRRLEAQLRERQAREGSA